VTRKPVPKARGHRQQKRPPARAPILPPERLQPLRRRHQSAGIVVEAFARDAHELARNLQWLATWLRGQHAEIP